MQLIIRYIVAMEARKEAIAMHRHDRLTSQCALLPNAHSLLAPYYKMSSSLLLFLLISFRFIYLKQGTVGKTRYAMAIDDWTSRFGSQKKITIFRNVWLTNRNRNVDGGRRSSAAGRVDACQSDVDRMRCALHCTASARLSRSCLFWLSFRFLFLFLFFFTQNLFLCLLAPAVSSTTAAMAR